MTAKRKCVLGFTALCAILFFLLSVPTAQAQGIFAWQAKGFVEATYYPPHNEFDPNPGIPFAERVVARYALEVELELRPKFAPRIVLFTDVQGYFGDSRPQLDYNWSAKPIVTYYTYGIGYKVFRRPNIEVRLAHGQWKNLGGYPVGESRLWSGLKVRWTFGEK